jgi:hypothetical protein
VLGLCSEGYANDITDAIVWAVGGNINGIPKNTRPAKIISLSLAGSGPCPSYLQSAINQAHSMGVLVVTAAGNDGLPSIQNTFPANCQYVISIGSQSKNGNVSIFSNKGATLYAPGEYIPILTHNLRVIYGTGTSYATPHLSGLFAINNFSHINDQLPYRSFDKVSGQDATCPAGRYLLSVISGSAYCQYCDAGSYTNGGLPASCTLCESGSYNTHIGASYCTTCPAGTRSTIPMGFSATAKGATGCKACDPGYYSFEKSATCTVCPNGQSAPAGSTSCYVCPVGKYSYPGYNCPSCEMKTYNDVTGATACKSCPADYTTSNSGSTSLSNCFACGVGSYLSGWVCYPCDGCGGDFRINCGGSNAGSCMACICPNNQYRSSGCTLNVLPTCSGCPSNTFSRTGNNFQITSCSANSGFYGNLGTAALPCGAGYFCPQSAITQTQCTAGTYCPSGSTSPINCSTNTQSIPGSSNILDCKANAGFFGVGSATMCSVGTFTDLPGRTACTSCATSTYMTSSGATTCLGCASACTVNQFTQVDCTASTDRVCCGR